MIGQHVLADFYDVAAGRLVDGVLLADCLGEARVGAGCIRSAPRCCTASKGAASQATSSSRSLTSRSTPTPSIDISPSIFSPAEVPIPGPHFRSSSPHSSPAASGSPRRPAAEIPHRN